MECPNCHNANKCGDYEGPACEVCGGTGEVETVLLECPFCGVVPVLKTFAESVFVVECDNDECGVGSETSAVDQADAIKAWNTRHSGWVQASQPAGTDSYGNTPDRIINCCFPDCGCDGARLCMAENGASSGAIELNLERRRR